MELTCYAQGPCTLTTYRIPHPINEPPHSCHEAVRKSNPTCIYFLNLRSCHILNAVRGIKEEEKKSDKTNGSALKGR